MRAVVALLSLACRFLAADFDTLAADAIAGALPCLNLSHPDVRRIHAERAGYVRDALACLDCVRERRPRGGERGAEAAHFRMRLALAVQAASPVVENVGAG